jgi:hypothetical protein
MLACPPLQQFPNPFLHTHDQDVFTDDGQPRKIAASAEEKDHIFMRQAFPRQEKTDDKISVPDTTSRVEVRDVQGALFAQSIKKAPGIDKLGSRTLRLL